MHTNRLLGSLLLLAACGCAPLDPADIAASDPAVVREYPTGSNILRRDRGVPSEVKVYGKSYAEEMVQQADLLPAPAGPKN